MSEMEVIGLQTGCKGGVPVCGILWWGEAPERPKKLTRV
jgi:hypothetical protein